MSYMILRTPCYSGGTYNASQQTYITWRDVEGDEIAEQHGWEYAQSIAEWDTEEEAQACIDEQDTGTYYLSHGEMGRPTYEIIEDGITGLDDCIHADGSETGDESVDKDDLSDGILRALESLNVVWSYSDGDVDVYKEELEGDDYIDDIDALGDDHISYIYGIVFCPRSEAIQRAGDDLSNLDWDHAGYYRREV